MFDHINLTPEQKVKFDEIIQLSVEIDILEDDYISGKATDLTNEVSKSVDKMERQANLIDILANEIGIDEDELMNIVTEITDQKRTERIADEVFDGDQNMMLDEGITLGEAKRQFIEFNSKK